MQIIKNTVYIILISIFTILPAIAEEVIEQQISQKHKDKCFTETGKIKVCVGHPNSSETNFIIDYPKKTIRAKSSLNFKISEQTNKVFFFFEPVVKKAFLNKSEVKTERRKTPGNEDWIIVIPVQPNLKEYNLELEYDITKLTKWGHSWKPFWWLTDYSDSSDARFSNVFTPASFEAERYPMTYTFEFKGLKDELNLYTSASVTHKIGKNYYVLKFADWNNLAGPYFEFTSLKYQSHSFIYKGKYKPVPVTLYFDPSLGKPKGIKNNTIIKKTENIIRNTLKKFESTFGQYAFDKLLVKLYSLQEGDLPLKLEYSMEFGGAVVSRLELIPHELCHQWFGRGASPVDGQAGFVDELVCDWYDYNNPVKPPKVEKPTLLSSKNSFTLRTPEESYREGKFFREMAYVYKQHNLDIYTFLKEFYQKFRLSGYSKDDFVKQLETGYPGDLKPYFKRYIDGIDDKND